jgi:hypothetical protein
MPCLAFCANCGSDRLDVASAGQQGIEVRCYVCTKTFRLQGLILGEVDFLAGAQAKVDAMVQRAKVKAQARFAPTKR